MRGYLIKTAFILALILVSQGCIESPSFGEDMEFDQYWGSQHEMNYYLNDNGNDATVVNLTAGQGELAFSMYSEWGGTDPLAMGGVRFRYRNGTVTEDLEVNEDDGVTFVTLPGEPGELGFATRNPSGYFEQKTPITGDIKVVLPEGHDSRNIFLGEMSPGGYEVTGENPVVIEWNDMEKETRVIVDYYEEKDPFYLILLLVGMIIATIGVLIYFRREFNKSRDNRLKMEDDH